jgi:hypothetical protein
MTSDTPPHIKTTDPRLSVWISASTQNHITSSPISTQNPRDFHHKRYCTATFIDISQAFDKVWHRGLLYKLKRALPHPLYSILKPYLTNRVFQMRYQEEYTSLHTVHSGVLQGSILGPILYSIFTADLPVSAQTLTATYTVLHLHCRPNRQRTNTHRHLRRRYGNIGVTHRSHHGSPTPPATSG